MSAPRSSLIIAMGLCLAATATQVQGALTLIGNTSLANVGNLVTNGSFEDVSGPPPGPGQGFANQRLWATGTTQNFVPFAVPNGWTSSGQPNTYAVWGNDDQPPNVFKLRDSDVLPDGDFGMYFGNAGSQVDQPPTFNPDGTVSFPNPATVTFTPGFGGTATLSQTVNTPATPSPSYKLSFWVSGEGAFFPNTDEGIFGFRMTNVLAGDPINYLAVPAGAGPQGASRFFQYSFVPLNPLNPVTIEFINWGHMDLTPYGGTGTTELVLDHVIIQVPEPGSLALATLSIVGLTAAARSKHFRRCAS